MSSSPEHGTRPLRVLMVHNHYLVRGGEDASFDAETELLRSGGHEVETYTRKNEEVEERGRFRTAADTIWSRGSRREVANLLAERPFDVMHVQNSFPLISPSVFGAAREAGVAVVQTLRNYRSFCVNGLLLREGRNCEECLGKPFGWSGVRHRCYRDSLPGSVVVAGMNALHRWRKTYAREVDRFIVASDFVRRKHVAGGFSEERMRLKPNVVADLTDLKPDGPREGAVFVGRLAADKGIRPIVEAWLEHKIEIPLKVVGSGPLEHELKRRAGENPFIEFTGGLPIREACRVIAESELLLLPTQCFETFGRTVLEAYAVGTPVISSRNTAPAELVLENETGFLVTGGDVGELADSVRRFFALPEDARRAMGKRGFEHYQSGFSRERNLELLTTIYLEAMEEQKQRSGQLG